MKIVSKDFCIFTGVYIAIYVGQCCKSYILLFRKFQTSEMLDKWKLEKSTSKLSDIKLPHIPDGQYFIFTCTRTRLSVNFADLGLSLPLSTFCIILQCSCGLVFLQTLIKSLLTESLRVFTEYIFFLAQEKKTPRKKPSKNVSQNSIKNIRPDSLSRENAISVTPIIPSEKSIDSYKLMPLGDLSLNAFSSFSDLTLEFLFF